MKAVVAEAKTALDGSDIEAIRLAKLTEVGQKLAGLVYAAGSSGSDRRQQRQQAIAEPERC